MSSVSVGASAGRIAGASAQKAAPAEVAWAAREAWAVGGDYMYFARYRSPLQNLRLQNYKKIMTYANTYAIFSFFVLLLQGIKVDQFVDDGIDSESGGGVDIQFAGDMLAVGNNGVHGDT